MPDALKPGLYEALITQEIARVLERAESGGYTALRKPISPSEAHVLLGRHLLSVVTRCFKSLGNDEDGRAQAVLCNSLIQVLHEKVPSAFDLAEDLIPESPEALLALLQREALATPPIERPIIPLSSAALLTNAAGDPSIGRQICRELDSADDADLLCAFVRWQGVRVFIEPLKRFLARGGRLRLITTTYMGVTELEALVRLAALGAQIRVSYETRTTRLHAKAWMFHRNSGYSTGFVGSSNLSRTALLDGLEWNVRTSSIATPEVFDKCRASFESYWEDTSFVPFSEEQFAVAMESQRRDEPLTLTPFEIRPFPYQEEILDRLEVERVRHGRWKNLVVAATGTGKTVIAALDYKRLRTMAGAGRLLFVAHREEILRQSLQTFRHVLRDGAFGELYVGGVRPQEWTHVFASIQSLSASGVEVIPEEHFDVVIVDEFHHAAASTYRALLSRLRPRVLLGLTATPERTDGESVTVWFDNRIAAELRLWEAIHRGLLVPFQYFGISDGTDLSRLRWRRGAYAIEDIEGVYTADHARVGMVLDALAERVLEPRKMRALGFCVSVRHAEFMAQAFELAGIPARAVSGNSDREARDGALRGLADGSVNAVFAVDLLNEGIDVPAVDTVLFLRPTESATVFLQQLGRGLRLAEGKTCLTVLDFIGRQHEDFRFDLRFSALIEAQHGRVERQIEQRFPFLPAGCQIELDRVAQETILESIKRSLTRRRGELVADVASAGEVSLVEFLNQFRQWRLADVYRGVGACWSLQRERAGFTVPSSGPDQKELRSALGRLLHIDDEERLGLYSRLLAGVAAPNLGALSVRDERLLNMLHLSIWGVKSRLSLSEGLRRLWDHQDVLVELRELLAALKEAAPRVTSPLSADGVEPLHVHARYSTGEALAGLGRFGADNAFAMREGVTFIEAASACALFVTLKKSESDYSPSTMYQDFPISQDLFHWETQGKTSPESPQGRRYREHEARQVRMLLFMRAEKEFDGRTAPYLFLGPVTFVSSESSRPMKIVWRLGTKMPPDLFEEARIASG